MSDSSNNANRPGKKRDLPSWMSARQDKANPSQTKSSNVDAREGSGGDEALKFARHGAEGAHDGGSKNLVVNADFSKLMEGVVFVLSGFVNPERGALRSQALEMGAQYQADWNSGCTLLVCAFPNTPKFRQVEADCGTIVSKDWITECYNQRKLVDIETYLMHPGKPWRRQAGSLEANQDQEPSTSVKSQKQVEKGLHGKPAASASSKVKEHFSPSKVKQWAVSDFNKTLSWLESQDEKPDPSEIREVAAEGILTCLQDTIDALEQDQDIKQITEQWASVPQVVEELAKIYVSKRDSCSLHKKLCEQAASCKQIYELHLINIDNDCNLTKKKPKIASSEKVVKGKRAEEDHATYDSDETIEMTGGN